MALGCRVKIFAADDSVSILLQVLNNNMCVPLHYITPSKSQRTPAPRRVSDRMSEQDLTSALARFCADAFAWETLYGVWKQRLFVKFNCVMGGKNPICCAGLALISFNFQTCCYRTCARLKRCSSLTKAKLWIFSPFSCVVHLLYSSTLVSESFWHWDWNKRSNKSRWAGFAQIAMHSTKRRAKLKIHGALLFML